MAAAVVSSVEVDEASVCQFLASLLPAGMAYNGAAPAAAAGLAAPQAATALSASQAAPPLRLHPRVDAVHPLGEAHTAQELVDALKLYQQLVEGMQLEVEDVLLGPDKALATGRVVVSSYLARLAAAGGSVAASAATQLPSPLHSLANEAAQLLPAGLVAGRVPITINMRIGKSDAGDPVVTHMSLVFSLLSMLVPHVALQPWQQEMLAKAQPQLMSLLLQAGSAATVAGDVSTSVGASLRAATAMLQATVGQVLGVVKDKVQDAWSGGGAAAHDAATAARPAAPTATPATAAQAFE